MFTFDCKVHALLVTHVRIHGHVAHIPDARVWYCSTGRPKIVHSLFRKLHYYKCATSINERRVKHLLVNAMYMLSIDRQYQKMILRDFVRVTLIIRFNDSLSWKSWYA